MSMRYRNFLKAVFSAVIIFILSATPVKASQFSPEIQTAASSEFSRGYPQWVATYVTAENTGGVGRLRVKRPQNENDTVSEGIGYGMILSAHAKDWKTFTGLWAYAKAYHNTNGLMSWRVKADGSVPDKNSATDADLDMAYALAIAGKSRPQYTTEAVTLIKAIMNHCVEPGTFILKPGDVWGGSSVTNPSYFSPAYYQIFKTLTGNTNWDRVRQAGEKVMETTMAKRGSTATGLLPNWTTASGDTVSYMGGDNDKYGFDATRIPLRQAFFVELYPSLSAYSKNYLVRLNAFFEKIGITKVGANYTLSGTATQTWHNAAFVGPIATATIISTHADYQAAALKELTRLSNDSYYSDSLRMLSLLVMSGKLSSP